MASMNFGNLRLDPAKNPAVLDTATWNPQAAWDLVRTLDDRYWQALQDWAAGRGALPQSAVCTLSSGSCARYRKSDFLLAGLNDGQQVFIEVGAGEQESALGKAIGRKALQNGKQAAVYSTDAETTDRFCRVIKPVKGPRALGATPRLGIGVRMSTSVWPGIWPAMAEHDFAANAIQNSLRELNMLGDLLAGEPARTNYLFSFGSMAEGHTGSTFEGLWVYGVLSALGSESVPRYGADADHIMVKRGPEGLSRAMRVIDSARYYTFFTLDVSDILDYRAMGETSPVSAEAGLAESIPDLHRRNEVCAYHGQSRRIGGQAYAPERATLGRLVGKYWKALDAVQALCNHIQRLKDGTPFDLELSIDENPPEVRTCESLTGDVELMFLILEAQRRQIPLTHIAPNFGVEKGVDYRCPGGLEELEPRVRRLHDIASESGLMLDCHSGDDLKAATRRVFGRATQGRIHFKISPCLQVIFGETLNDLYPELFQFWWEDTLAYARREAAGGAEVALACLREYQSGVRPEPSARSSLFGHFNFATVGKRDARGQFIFRERFYELPAAFYHEYARRVERCLVEVAADLFVS
jgi:hypothetical protein